MVKYEWPTVKHHNNNCYKRESLLVHVKIITEKNDMKIWGDYICSLKNISPHVNFFNYKEVTVTTVEKSGRQPLNQVSRVNIPAPECVLQTLWNLWQDTLRLAEHHNQGILAKKRKNNLNLIMRNHKKNKNRGIFCKMTGQSSSKMTMSWKTKWKWRTANDERRLSKGSEWRRQRILNCILDQKRTLGAKGKLGQKQPGKRKAGDMGEVCSLVNSIVSI